MKKLLGSRKFTTAIVGALLVGLNDSLKLGLSADTIQNIVLILSAWLVGESAIDAASAWGGQAAKATTVPVTTTTSGAPH